MAGEILAKYLAEAKGNSQEFTDIVFGRVIELTPLKIQIDNRFEVGAEFLILSAMVQELKVKIKIPDTIAKQKKVFNVALKEKKPDITKDVEELMVVSEIMNNEKEIEIEVFKPLAVSDEVRMLRSQNGQLYYVLDRR
ncbi:DUF2577 family protein [Carnobacterium maltaromaticum]|uniref:DUF2577 family protein n=1 Tax=Carnobacterium TaxID=2747 RepID=UPI00026C85E8|nr:DUF2577 family protein [Carnobacterium maltaromaticum]MDW5522393.1 DUF2577 family protein [Carnobacterium maltaromaticum]CAD5900541.1 conserved hypothetical protein [Carnobacterium maltaromaticum]